MLTLSKAKFLPFSHRFLLFCVISRSLWLCGSDPRKEKRGTISLNSKDAHQRGTSLLYSHNSQRSSSQKNNANLKREPIFSSNPSPPPLPCRAMRSTLNAPLKRSSSKLKYFFVKHKHYPHPQITISAAGSLPAAFSCMTKQNHSLLSQHMHIRCLLKWEWGSEIVCLVWKVHLATSQEKTTTPPPPAVQSHSLICGAPTSLWVQGQHPSDCWGNCEAQN